MSEVLEMWLERAAILEFDAGMSRSEAEEEAARLYGVLPELEWLRRAAQEGV